MIQQAWMIGVLFCAFAVPLACGVPEANFDQSTFLQLALQSGTTIAQLVDDSSVSIFLVLRPTECFSCSNDLHRWLEVAANGGGHATIILTQEPNTDELKAIRRLRIKYELVANHSRRSLQRASPLIAVYADRPQSTIFVQRVRNSDRAILLDSVRRNMLSR